MDEHTHDDAHRSSDERLRRLEERLERLEAHIAELRASATAGGGPEGPRYYESGSVRPDLDDQTIAP